ncbi:MAG: carboxypeptidase M32 [Phycisphaerae bacterium]|nr:carboxypeptidase M32 [Phycisphaerae bacterium]
MPSAKKKRVAVRSKSPYADLAKELREIAVLSSVGSVIGWDQETMMPDRGAALRAEQREAISGLVHVRRTSRKLGDLISASESWAKRSGDAKVLANLREVRRDYDRATKLPASLVAEITRCASLGMEAWKDARKNSDFKKFLPWLKKTMDLAREKARCYGIPKPTRGAPKPEVYDALLDEYEPDMTAARTDAIFGPLRERLVPMIESVAGSRSKPSEAPARVRLPIDKQKEFVRRVCGAIGFQFESGRMDESAHPFCEGIGPGDTRMTNRYRADGWTDALGTAMHESGHAMYEQGLPKDECFGQPLAEAISLGIHESQSRMWENLVGRSRAFWKWGRGEARQVFGDSVGRASADDLYKAVNLIRPNFIRVESDELTYNLHIMLRFDLERAMINGSMNPRDLPEVWNRRLKNDFGLTVPDDRRGCLQDVHWSAGLVGYFPTYTFGNLYAAQFWEAMARDLPKRDSLIERGEFGPILAWLRKNIHAHGRRYSAEDLCKRVTGKPLTHDALLRHLESKVRNVYG